MTFIDERGRLFGRVNVIDAAAAGVILVLLPIVYGAYRLFRPDPIVLISVDPSRVVLSGETRVRLKGEHLRPYLRAQIGPAQPKRFLIETPSEGEITLPDLAPGTYDVSLYDDAQRVALLKAGLVVDPPPGPPPITVQLTGSFIGLDMAAAKTIQQGKRFTNGQESVAEVLEAAEPRPDTRDVKISAVTSAAISVGVANRWQVPATLRAACAFYPDSQRCKVGNVILVPEAVFALGDGKQFFVTDVRPDSPGRPFDLTVRFTGRPEVLDMLAVNDTDTLPGGGSRAARIFAISSRQAVAGETTVRVQNPINGIISDTRIPDRVAVVEATVRLIAVETPTGPVYRGGSIKNGSLFVFDSGHYVAQGPIVRTTPTRRP